MERKVGEIFEYNGEWYQCAQGGFSCADCDIKGDCSSISIRACSSRLRKDENKVIFKKLEKVGVPFVKKVLGDIYYTFQRYKVYYNSVILPIEPYIYWNFIDGTVEIEIKQNKEDMKEKKLNLKEFNLEAAKAGKPVCTRDGRKVRIICFDAKCNKPIVALIYDCNKETVLQYLENGRFFVDQIDKYDLMMLPQKKEGWVNIYNDFGDRVCDIYPTKEEAIKNKDKEDYITTVNIEWEE